MHRQVGDLRLNGDGLAERGLLLRHLVMPEGLEDAQAILHWVATHLSRSTWLNLMDQYNPAHQAAKFPGLNRRPFPSEIEGAYALAWREGLQRLDKRSPRRRRRL
jgi:putative pyruvate formate lyase activating enzyme